MNRRNFVKHILSSTMGLGSASAALSSMSLVNSALAQTSRRFDDYKALVCIFLHGGNDSFNMLIPNEANDYQNYQKVRQNLVIAQSDLMPISPISSMPYNLALPSFMSPMRQLLAKEI